MTSRFRGSVAFLIVLMLIATAVLGACGEPTVPEPTEEKAVDTAARRSRPKPPRNQQQYQLNLLRNQQRQ